MVKFRDIKTTFTPVNSLIFSAIILLLVSACSFNSKVLLFRKAFDAGGEKVNADLEKHVPQNIKSMLDIHYNPADTDAYLDVYYPENVETAWNDRPAIFWIHGGGWIAGSKSQLTNYAKILAQKGYTVVVPEYSLAPERRHPFPIIQLNKALDFLTKNNSKYHVNKKRLVIAGDSGGAQIAAQLGIVLTDSAYAKKLGVIPQVPRSNISGMILYCGTYNFDKATSDREGVVLRMMLRAYSGQSKYKPRSYFALASVAHHIPENYPATFISTGNSDILKDHSYELADILKDKGIKVDSLFFKDNNEVSLGHEYQFNLDDDSGKLALDRTVKFLKSLD